ncbi:hypothetical protein F5Y08DRAFT_340299 [Xylaria arbuscula]|nr:hypothetical protein F5Y08DRAFT_340299 [Xylaria arbuscula]
MLISRIFQALIALPIVLAVPHAAPPQKTPGYDPKNPYNATVIRFSKMGCWDMKLDYNNLIKATEKLKDWGKQKGKKIPAGGVRGQDQVWEAAWICNCKHFYKDHAPAAEIDEAFRIVNQTCHHGSDGTMNGGWVWSKKWQKSWNFGTANLMYDIIPGSYKCPKFCLWGWGNPKDDWNRWNGRL